MNDMLRPAPSVLTFVLDGGYPLNVGEPTVRRRLPGRAPRWQQWQRDQWVDCAPIARPAPSTSPVVAVERDPDWLREDCRKGHDANWRVNRDGHRVCRTCDQKRTERRRKQRQEARA